MKFQDYLIITWKDGSVDERGPINLWIVTGKLHILNSNFKGNYIISLLHLLCTCFVLCSLVIITISTWVMLFPNRSCIITAWFSFVITISHVRTHMFVFDAVAVVGFSTTKRTTRIKTTDISISICIWLKLDNAQSCHLAIATNHTSIVTGKQ